jgi:hypothetical protein
MARTQEYFDNPLPEARRHRLAGKLSLEGLVARMSDHLD